MSLKEIIIREIRKIKTEIVSPLAIQVPEGLKQFSTLILEELKDYSPALLLILAMVLAISSLKKQKN